MIIIEDKPIAYVDVDDTLVLFDVNPENCLTIGMPGYEVTVTPNKGVIKKIKEHKARNHTIVVWSQGGSFWAEMVVKALELEKYVDIIAPKAYWFYDDIPASAFMDENKRINIR